MRWKRLAFLSTWLNLVGFVGLFCFAFVCFVVVVIPFGSELVVFGIPLSSHLIFLLSTSQQSSFHEIVSVLLCVLWLAKDPSRDLGSHYAGHWVNLLRKSATPRAFSHAGKEKERGWKGYSLGEITEWNPGLPSANLMPLSAVHTAFPMVYAVLHNQ